MSGRRRYHEPAPCKVCGKVCATLVPWHGDGSLALTVTHGPRGARCPGSRTEPSPTPEPPLLERCVHGRRRIDPCLDCRRRYVDGQLDPGADGLPDCSGCLLPDDGMHRGDCPYAALAR